METVKSKAKLSLARRQSRMASVAAPPEPHLFRIPSNITVRLGLEWQFIGDEPVDLDASCVAFDKAGNCLEAVFFNHLSSDEGYMFHTGDNTTGEDVGEDDEAIIFHMAKIPSVVQYLMVCVTSYTGATFTSVESANVRIVNEATKEVVGQFALNVVGEHTGTLLCAFSRIENAAKTPGQSPGAQPLGAAGQEVWWDLRGINDPCDGPTFCEVLPRMMDMLHIPMAVRADRLLLLPDYSLEKIIDLSEIVLSQLRVGLGWDGENDLDLGVVMLDAQCRYVDRIFTKMSPLRSADRAMRHSGDKLNGYDVEGDDEEIEIDLNKVSPAVQFIFIFATLYSGESATLREVPKAYLRVANKSGPVASSHEIDRININNIEGDATGLVGYVVKRKTAAVWDTLVRCNETLMAATSTDVFPFVQAYARLGCSDALWQQWKADVHPFGVEVSFGEVRGFGPLLPDYFSCRCFAWVTDKDTPVKAQRFSSQRASDRDDINFGESFVFTVDKLDSIRVMLYESSIVGWLDIPMNQFYGILGEYLEPKTSTASTDLSPGTSHIFEPRISGFAATSFCGSSATPNGGTPKGTPKDTPRNKVQSVSPGVAASAAGEDSGSFKRPPSNSPAAALPTQLDESALESAPLSVAGDDDTDDGTGGGGGRARTVMVHSPPKPEGSMSPKASRRSPQTSSRSSKQQSTVFISHGDEAVEMPVVPAAELALVRRRNDHPAATFPAEGALLADAWYSFKGCDIIGTPVHGEIKLRLTRVPLPVVAKNEAGGCVVM
jgi:stress response protein SCP2